MEEKKSGIGGVAIIFIIVIAVVFGGIYITRNVGKSQKTISKEDAGKKLEKMVKKIEPEQGRPFKSSVEYSDDDTLAEELPDIDTCAVNVKANTGLYAEIYCSPEKAGSGTVNLCIKTGICFNINCTCINIRQLFSQCIII